MIDRLRVFMHRPLRDCRPRPAVRSSRSRRSCSAPPRLALIGDRSRTPSRPREPPRLAAEPDPVANPPAAPAAALELPSEEGPTDQRHGVALRRRGGQDRRRARFLAGYLALHATGSAARDADRRRERELRRRLEPTRRASRRRARPPAARAADPRRRRRQAARRAARADRRTAARATRCGSSSRSGARGWTVTNVGS